MQTLAPLLTLSLHEALLAARNSQAITVACTLDLGRSMTTVEPGLTEWRWHERAFPYLDSCKDRTIYYWAEHAGFQPAARFTTALVKLVPTEWGPPTFEIDGVKMLPTARISPYADAQRKVGLIQAAGKTILDSCGGLGYFAACCLHDQALRVHSYERSAEVIWLRSLNPWSPVTNTVLTLTQADIGEAISQHADQSFDAILHDPPRFSLAGELYSQRFYAQLARVLKRHGKLFHYTGAPNKVSRGRDLAGEVTMRLRRAGFSTELNGDGVLAVR